MARLFDDASSQYLEHAAAVVGSYPMTLACWYNSNDLTVTQTLIGITTTGSDNHRIDLRVSGAVAGDPVTLAVRNATTTAGAGSTTGSTVDTWHHACGVLTSATSRAAFIDGGSKGTSATNITPSGMDTTSIGRLTITTPQLYISGRIAEAAIWNVALSDTEVAILAKGVSPLLIQPTALVAYWPLWGIHSDEPDLHNIGSTRYAMTVTGATAANHAPVVPYSRRFWTASVPLIEEAEAAGQPMLLRHSLKTGWQRVGRGI